METARRVRVVSGGANLRVLMTLWLVGRTHRMMGLTR